MADTTFVDDGGVVVSDADVDRSSLQSLVGSKTIAILGLAGVLALSGASAAGVSAFSGVAYDGGGACQSYYINSFTDPDIQTGFAGRSVARGHSASSLSNLATVYNTTGGQTTLSTTVQEVSPTFSDNRGVTLAHAGSQGWTMNVSSLRVLDAAGDAIPGAATYAATVVDASGTHALPTVGTFVEADGTTFRATPDGYLYVSQPLAAGGGLGTEIHADVTNDDAYGQLGVSQQSNSAIVVSGTSISQALGSNASVLALPPCSMPSPPPADPTPTTSGANAGQAGSVSKDAGTTPTGVANDPSTGVESL